MIYVNERIKDLYRVAQPEGRGSYIRLDQNENPDGLPKWLFDSVMEKVTPEFLSIYPEETIPTTKYAKMLGLEKENVTFTDGSVIGMGYVIKVFGEAGKDILCVTPSFAMYGKGLKCKAYMEIVDGDGGIQYSDIIKHITVRGNKTAEWYKKEFTISLRQPYSLLGLNKERKFALLANAQENTKMLYKLTLDIARDVGMQYVPRMEYIDVYINGTYWGNYLLAEKIDAVDGVLKKDNSNIEISSLIGKDYPAYAAKEKYTFKLNRNYDFSVHYPEELMNYQIEDLRDKYEEIDKDILLNDTSVLQKIDVKSFAYMHIISEMSLNVNTNVTSSFFYTNKDSPLIYAGPPWDYDVGYGPYAVTDYQDSLNGTSDEIPNIRGEEIALDWFVRLYAFPEYYETLQDCYLEMRQKYLDWIENRIDNTDDTIKASVEMDVIRWPGYSEGVRPFYDHENCIRYLKIFISNRITYLDKRLGVQPVDYNHLCVHNNK